MVFCKVIKNKAYFKRYQVKYRRRREGKTDYHARRKLVNQDKDKYDSHRYRFVVRITNTKVICQITMATIEGDKIIADADSTELVRYGIKVGLTNYSACYCVGLLVARRLLKNLNMDSIFTGNKNIDGADYHEEENDNDRRPFKCLLDVGIRSTTTGNRVFGAMKGACDGGIYIPHSVKRFPGYEKQEGSKEGSYDASKHRDRIYGKHVAEYMKKLKEEDMDKYKLQFGEYIKAQISADDIEGLYKKAHESIRKSPQRVKKPIKEYKYERINNTKVKVGDKTIVRHSKLNKEQRKQRVQEKLKKIASMRKGE